MKINRKVLKHCIICCILCSVCNNFNSNDKETCYSIIICIIIIYGILLIQTLYNFYCYSPSIQRIKISQMQTFEVAYQPQQMKISQATTKLYIRRPNKSTVISYVKHTISGNQLVELAALKTNINRQKIILFLRGQKISYNEQNQNDVFCISDSDILHVHNIQNASKKFINIIIKPFQCPTLKCQQNYFVSAKSKDQIKQSLKNHFKITEDLCFIQSGRKLNINLTYQQQSIQDQSLIYVTNFRPPSQSDINTSQNIQNKVLQKKLGILQQKQINFAKNKLQQIKKISTPQKHQLRKSTSWGEAESCSITSFKKKQKPSIYKSMKIMDGKEQVWVSDSSGDLNSNLIKQISIKKHRDNFYIKEQKSIENRNSDRDDQDQHSEESQTKQANFSPQQKKQLRRQLNKLLFSDFLDLKPVQMTNAPPPKMSTDDFLEEQAQQIQIKPDGYDEDNQNDDDQQQQIQVKSPSKSLDLRQSIGKSRGSFVVPMIPTRDFQKFSNQSSSDEDEDEQQQN